MQSESFDNVDDVLSRMAEYRSSPLHLTHFMRIGGDLPEGRDLERLQEAGIEEAGAHVPPKDGPRTE